MNDPLIKFYEEQRDRRERDFHALLDSPEYKAFKEREPELAAKLLKLSEYQMFSGVLRGFEMAKAFKIG